jgi:hypothetical protein
VVTLVLRAQSVIYVPRPTCLDSALPLRYQYWQHISSTARAKTSER